MDMDEIVLHKEEQGTFKAEQITTIAACDRARRLNLELNQD